MNWTEAAERAIARVPFFVRRRVNKRVEEEALRQGAQEVGLEHVEACQRRYLEDMESEVKGYQVETCFGRNGCPNRVTMDDGLAEALEQALARRNLKGFLKERVEGPLKMHHEFRVSVADCPNACSRPQIVDFGVIGACRPTLTGETCTRCGACVEACQERAVELPDDAGDRPRIIEKLCVGCGKCVSVCPFGTIGEARRGYRVLIGGKLGRHPRLAREMPGIYNAREVLDFLHRCLEITFAHNRRGERFGEVLDRTGWESVMPG